MSMMIISCNADDRKVTMKNVEEFKATMNSTLPPGSSKKQVEDYLSNLNLENTYVDEDKMFYAIVPKIGRYRIIYETSLLIRIKLDHLNRVKNIVYKLEHSGL